MSSLVFPSSVGAVVAARANAWLGDGARLALDASRAGGDERRRASDLIRLAGDAAEIDMLATHLAYDTSQVRDVARHVQALRLRMLMLLPVLSSIADRLAVLRNDGHGAAAAGARRPRRLRAWIRPEPPSSRRSPTRQREAAEADACAPPSRTRAGLDAGSDWTTIITASLMLRLREFVDLASDSRALRRAIAHGRGLPATAVPPEAASPLVRHRDHAMALLSSCRRFDRDRDLLRFLDRNRLARRLRRAHDGGRGLLLLRLAGRSRSGHPAVRQLTLRGRGR